MVKAKIKFTYEDYKSLPESDTERYELLEGELVTVPSPTVTHQRVSGNIVDVLRKFVREHGLGTVLYAPCDVVLSDPDGTNVVQPDILYIAGENVGIMTEEEVRGAPDLVVEILSKATADRDRTYKRTLYARHGVKEYWLVDPETKMVEVLTLREAGFARAGLYRENELLRSSLLTGLEMDLKEVFG